MPTGSLHPNQILSNYLKQYGSYCLHKILAVNYITKTVRVVSLACDVPIGPPLQSYQILSKYVQGYRSYGAHKDASTDRRHTDCYFPPQPHPHPHPPPPPPPPPSILSKYVQGYRSYGAHKDASTDRGHTDCYIPPPYYQNMSKGIEVMEHTRMRLQTGAILIAISPPCFLYISI